MSRPGFATRAQLKSWADTVQSKSELPRLIRRLILETTPGLEGLGMPAGEGVAIGGWDGSVSSSSTTAFVPEGLSVWELSTDDSPNAKANIDWEKRSTTPDGTSPREATYVEGILRTWRDRDAWAKARRDEAKFKDVKAYGLDEIETWLESAPITWAWFSEQLGLHPFGLRTADQWWDSWASQTEPRLSPEVVLAGRQANMDALDERLDVGGIVTIGGASLEEMCAFVAARSLLAQAKDQGRLLARVAFVDDLSTWRELLLSASPLVLVAMDEAFADEVSGQSPHTVIVPVGDAPDPDVELLPLEAKAVADALIASGLSDKQKAEEAARIARRSLTAMRRRLARKPALIRPPWADSPVSRPTRSLLLAGRWSDQSAGDQQILSDLCGESYEAVRDDASSLSHLADPFVMRVGQGWHLVSPADAWILLVRQLTTDDIQRFEDVVRQVLGEVDPSLELPKEVRWYRAALESRVFKYSRELRRGVAQSLALMSTFGESVELADGSTPGERSQLFVRNLLDAANADPSGRKWQSLADVLSLLAEAAPDAFVDALATASSGTDPVIRHMFADENDDGLHASSPHSSLLWALEVLAWSPEHFGSALDILARLDEIDPGGRLSNRPIASLTGILLPWHPENAASTASRLRALDAMRRYHPETAWRLILDLLPRSNSVHFGTSSPRFRSWKPDTIRVTIGEYTAFVAELVARAIEDADSVASRWEQLVEHYDDLPPNDRSALLDGLRSFIASDLSSDARALLWDALRRKVARHREFPDAPWVLPTSELDALDRVSGTVSPTEASERYRWLFNDWSPFLGDISRGDDFAAYDEELLRRRTGAVAEVEQEGGLEGVKRLAGTVEVSHAVGAALGGACPGYDDELLPLLDEGDPRMVELASEYYGRRFRAAGWEWLTAFMESHAKASPLQRARLLLTTRDHPASWEAAEQDDDVKGEFWKRFSPYGLGGDFAHVEFVAERLMEQGRHAAALDFLNMYVRRTQAENPRMIGLIVQGLEGFLAHQDDPEAGALKSYDFEALFEVLEQHRGEIEGERLAQLEWAYLLALGYEPNVPALSEKLATDPSFFVEVVCTAFRAKYEPNADAPDEPHYPNEAEPTAPEAGEGPGRAAMASVAYRLLNSWNVPPGLDADGSVDGEMLRTWFAEASAGLESKGRLDIGLEQIGHVLASMPPDADGTWPCRPLRDFLEEQQDPRLESGIFIQTLNRRGVTTRGLEDGGGQEQVLAERYRSDAERIADDAPRSAALLRKLVRSYQADARRNEASAERFRRGLD